MLRLPRGAECARVVPGRRCKSGYATFDRPATRTIPPCSPRFPRSRTKSFYLRCRPRRRNRRAQSLRPAPRRKWQNAAHGAAGPGLRPCISSSWQTPGSHRLAQLLERGHVTCQRLPVGELGGAIAALGVQVIEQAGGTMLVCVLADVPRILSLFQVTGLVQLHDFIIGAKRFIRVGHVGKRNRGLLARKLLRLCDRVLRACDFALVAVENRQLDIKEKRARVDAAEVVVSESGTQI